MWSEVRLVYPIVSALGGGDEVDIVADASVSTSRESHELAIMCMVQTRETPLSGSVLPVSSSAYQALHGTGDVSGPGLCREWQMLGLHERSR